MESPRAVFSGRGCRYASTSSDEKEVASRMKQEPSLVPGRSPASSTSTRAKTAGRRREGKRMP